jgi:hypothetical protein
MTYASAIFASPADQPGDGGTLCQVSGHTVPDTLSSLSHPKRALASHGRILGARRMQDMADTYHPG